MAFNKSAFTVLVIFFFVFILFFETRASAEMGLGAYIAGGSAFDDLKVRTDSRKKLTGKYNSIPFGGGLILDSNLNSRNRFNFRFKIGAEKADYSKSIPYKIIRVSQWNVFGFGIVAAKKVRWWVGPGFGFQYSGGTRGYKKYVGIEQTDHGYRLFIYQNQDAWYVAGLMRDRVYKLGIWNINTGLVTGLNINAGKNISICLEGGAIIGIMTGKWSRSVSDMYITGSPDRNMYAKPTINKFRERIRGRHFEAYFSFAVMYRGKYIKNL